MRINTNHHTPASHLVLLNSPPKTQLTPTGPDAAVQQIDFILATDTLANEKGYVFGETPTSPIHG